MGNITHTPVANSSNVASYGYDAESQTLEVKFHSGKTYRYPKTTQAEYDALKKAPSVGKHVSSNLRGRPFQTRQPDGSWA
jgi:hypothetical protein